MQALLTDSASKAKAKDGVGIGQLSRAFGVSRSGLYSARTLIRRHRLRACWRRKFVHTTDSNHRLPVADNVFKREFAPAGANQAWAGDITYIRTATGWLNCWDNAVTERFFLNLKMERVWQRQYANQAEAIRDIADYIVNFYNLHRLHSTLGYLSPNAFEQHRSQPPPTQITIRPIFLYEIN